MASIIGICNRALTKLGSNRITSLTDNTKGARVMAANYDSVRRAELRAHRWKFSITRTKLPRMVDVPAYGFAYMYQLPADQLRIDKIGRYEIVVNLLDYIGGETEMWQIEGDKILTHIGPPLPLRYARDVTDPNLFDALFAESLACKLGMEACEDLTQSTTKYQQLKDEYTVAMKDAIRVSAIERPPEALPDDSWMFSRL